METSAFLDDDALRAISLVMQRLPANYVVREVILFGSRARRDHRPDSDADVAVILEHLENRYEFIRHVASTAFDVLLETGVLVQTVPIGSDEFDNPALSTNPAFIRNIQSEGIRL